jgi:hypothetical protein
MNECTPLNRGAELDKWQKQKIMKTKFLPGEIKVGRCKVK